MKKLLLFILAFAGSFLNLFHGQGQGLKITPGGHLAVQSAYIRLSGNLVNEGSYSDTSGTLIFAGTSQEISGSSPVSLYNLVISAGSVTAIQQPGQALRGVLTSDGTLQANGNLTLLSTSVKTALISGEGTGEVTGNVTLERWLDSGIGYRYISSPFQSATVSEFAEEVDLGADFPAFYSYYENSDTTWWISHTTGTSLLVPMNGYAVNFGNDPAPITILISGEVTNHDASINLFNHNRTHTKGFNLAGNPYPSPVDWDAPSGWFRNNIDNAVYYFNPGGDNPYTGSYSTYINGISSDGIAGSIIPAMQGFFVHVSDGSFPVEGTLGFTNEVRVNSQNPVFHKPVRNEEDFMIRFSAGFEDPDKGADPLVILFDERASCGFNTSQDAIKLMNTNPSVPSFYSIAESSKRYAIKALPVPSDPMTVIPLGISIKQSGVVSFSVMSAEETGSFLHVYFSDKTNRAVIPVEPGTPYKVFLDEGDHDSRFSLIFSDHELETSGGSEKGLIAYCREGKIYVYLDLPDGETGDLLVSDITGRIIHRERASGIGYRSFDANVRSGIYIVSLRSDAGFASKKLFIQD